MTKIYAIKENHLFGRAYAKGERCATKNIVVYALKNFKTNQTRLGITTSKKIGKAVQRNRARRLIREAWRHTLENVEFNRPYLVVIVARGAATEKNRSMGEVRSDLEKALHTLRLVRKKEH